MKRLRGFVDPALILMVASALVASVFGSVTGFVVGDGILVNEIGERHLSPGGNSGTGTLHDLGQLETGAGTLTISYKYLYIAGSSNAGADLKTVVDGNLVDTNSFKSPRAVGDNPDSYADYSFTIEVDENPSIKFNYKNGDWGIGMRDLKIEYAPITSTSTTNQDATTSTSNDQVTSSSTTTTEDTTTSSSVVIHECAEKGGICTTDLVCPDGYAEDLTVSCLPAVSPRCCMEIAPEIKALEMMDLTGIGEDIPDVLGRMVSVAAYGKTTVDGGSGWMGLGGLIVYGEYSYDDEGQYLVEPGIVRVQVGWTEDYDLIDYPESKLTLFYDDTSIVVYLPTVTEAEKELFVASDGSTYYDQGLTDLARGVPEPISVEHLLINDLENMETLWDNGIADEVIYAWDYENLQLMLSGEDPPKLGYLSMYDSDEYGDDQTVSTSTGVVLTFDQNEGAITIPDSTGIRLTYDGGQTKTVYLPSGTYTEFTLYVASDGSTYYDYGLTDLAVGVPVENIDIRDVTPPELVDWGPKIESVNVDEEIVLTACWKHELSVDSAKVWLKFDSDQMDASHPEVSRNEVPQDEEPIDDWIDVVVEFNEELGCYVSSYEFSSDRLGDWSWKMNGVHFNYAGEEETGVTAENLITIKSEEIEICEDGSNNVCTEDVVTLCKDDEVWTGSSDCTCSEDAEIKLGDGWGECAPEVEHFVVTSVDSIELWNGLGDTSMVIIYHDRGNFEGIVGTDASVVWKRDRNENARLFTKISLSSGVILENSLVKIDGDGGSLKAYLPDGTFDEEVVLYVAKDGTTYYDFALTELAMGIPAVPVTTTSTIEIIEEVEIERTSSHSVKVKTGGLIAGESKRFELDDKVGGIFREIGIKPVQQQKNVDINVEAFLSETSSGERAPEPVGLSGVLLNYIHVDTPLRDDLIDRVNLKFAVGKGWMLANNILPNTVALWRFDGSTWVKLNTVKVGDSETEMFFESESTGFSFFSITGVREKVCSGNVEVGRALEGEKIKIDVSGLEYCEEEIVHIRENTCDGNDIVSWELSETSGLMDIPSKPGIYSYLACVDVDKDGVFNSVGESSKPFKVEKRGSVGTIGAPKFEFEIADSCLGDAPVSGKWGKCSDEGQVRTVYECDYSTSEWVPVSEARLCSSGLFLLQQDSGLLDDETGEVVDKTEDTGLFGFIDVIIKAILSIFGL